MDFNKKWNKKTYEEYINYLKSLEDIKYKKFNSGIVKTKLNMISIKIPILRKISKKIIKGDIDNYFKFNNFKYYEEVIIYALVLSYSEKNFKYINILIDNIDNWAVCDILCSSLKFINNNKRFYFNYFKKLIDLKKEYQTRISIVVMLNYYLCDEYIDDVLNIVSSIDTEYYYINMAISWLLCTATYKYKTKVINILSTKKLNKFVQNQTISKIQDSYRIEKQIKEKVKLYRITN